jgi:hypothetical protein
MLDFLSMGPTEDMRSWAFRLIHYGLIAGVICAAVIVLLVLQNFYIMHSLSKTRSQLRAIARTLNTPWKEPRD